MVSNWPATATEVTVSVTVETAGILEVPTEILIVAEPLDANGGPILEEGIGFAAGPGRWVVNLADDRRWHLFAEAAGYWGDRVEVVPESVGADIDLHLWRGGSVRGSLTTATAEPLPAYVDLQLEGEVPGASGSRPLQATVRCPVFEAAWECPIPVGQLDLRLAAGRFLAHRMRRVRIEPAESTDLGAFDLELGASVSGRVEVAGGGGQGGECRVRLEAIVRGRVVPHKVESAAACADGKFQIDGIPAGKYLLTATQPGYLEAASDPLQLRPGDSTELREPLVLRRLAALELVFSPPVAPEGRSWSFTLQRLEDANRGPGTPVRGAAGPDGIWSQEDLEPGTYDFQVTGSIGTNPIQKKIELPGGWSSLLIELPLVMVEGTVLAGGEPLAAAVTFIEGAETEKPGTSFSADASGAFSGLLPREGQWYVKVEAPEEGIDMTLAEVEVWTQGGTGVAFVEIRLPGTILEGEVTDMLGSPMAGAKLDIRRPGLVQESYSFEADDDGRFRIRGLEPGAISLMATANGLRSQNLDVILYEDRPGPALRIVVR